MYKKQYQDVAKRLNNLTPEHRVFHGNEEVRSKVLESIHTNSLKLTPHHVKYGYSLNYRMKLSKHKKSLRVPKLPSIKKQKNDRLKSLVYKDISEYGSAVKYGKTPEHHSLEVRI